MPVVITLDVRGTHQNRPDCPMRLIQDPHGQWMCFDCGLHILHQRLELVTEPIDPLDRQEDHRIMAEKRALEGVMTPDERTPTGLGCDVSEGGTR